MDATGSTAHSRTVGCPTGFEEAEILLSELLDRAGLDGWAFRSFDPEVTGIAFDSRAVSPGDLFVGLVGAHHDGGRFANQAIAGGAVAVVVDPSVGSDLGGVVQAAVIQIPTPNRKLLADLSLAFFGDISDGLCLIGVTGTNGKTTITHMIAHLSTRLGWNAAVIGTLNGERTTPESPELFGRLSNLKLSGAQVVALEVSSIAIDQDRIRNLRFTVGVFTNLSPDHLDYHGTMEQYFNAKAELFSSNRTKLGVINRDSAYGKKLLASAEISCIGFGLGDVTSIETSNETTSFIYRGQSFTIPVFGEHNLYNCIAAIEVARCLGFHLYDIAEAFKDFAGVAGRLERVNPGASPATYIDYAHSPDALIQATRALCLGLATGAKLIVVFGAGGNRDRSKRPLMGAAVASHANYAIVTNDNPRFEDPSEIANAIVDGFCAARDGFGFEVVFDRQDAISRAIELARPGDVILIAGKGHETYQVTGERTSRFSDLETARRILAISNEVPN